MMATFGDYIWCRKDQIPKAKKLLLEQMIDMIRELSKKNDFWEITRTLNVDAEKDTMVAYRISIPQMEDSDTCEIAENIENCEDCGFCSMRERK
jgi:phosphodiesterase/alkaline phosphatase D-like protein